MQTPICSTTTRWILQTAQCTFGIRGASEKKWEYIYLPFCFTRPTFSVPSSLQTQETPQDVTHSPTQQQSLLKRREKGHLLSAPREQESLGSKGRTKTQSIFISGVGILTPTPHCCGCVVVLLVSLSLQQIQTTTEETQTKRSERLKWQKTGTCTQTPEGYSSSSVCCRFAHAWLKCTWGQINNHH